jgi:hypothetical protein
MYEPENKLSLDTKSSTLILEFPAPKLKKSISIVFESPSSFILFFQAKWTKTHTIIPFNVSCSTQIKSKEFKENSNGTQVFTISKCSALGSKEYGL